MRKLIAAAAAVPLLCLMSLTASPSAQAQTSAICGNGGSGYCMNAWNGGPYVKMYYGGYTNDNFYLTTVSPCSGRNTVQSTMRGDATNCPFNNSLVDYLLWNNQIMEIVDANNGKCVGTGNLNGTPDVGYLGACGDNYGNGAIQGAFDVAVFGFQGDCSSSSVALVNRFWTNYYSGQERFVLSGGNPGTSLFVGSNVYTCWGGAGV
jgi:hypothetical protein